MVIGGVNKPCSIVSGHYDINQRSLSISFSLFVNVAVPIEECFIYPTNTSNKCAFYGVKGGTPLRNRRDRRTSIA